MSDLKKIRRALISVSDKTGVVEFAAALAAFGVTLVSTGGTARTLRGSGLEVLEVSDVTGFPEMMDGRVKTLHPKIHGALLALRGEPGHLASMRDHGIEPIDMVVIDLYPFERTIAAEVVKLEDAVENIDIGGPAMIRSASKNWQDVAVVTDPRLYDEVLAEITANNGSLSLETRQRFAVLAFTRTAAYDLAISSFLAGQLSEKDLERLEPLNPLGHLSFIEAIDPEHDADHSARPDEQLPASLDLKLEKAVDLRYGENPHQKGSLYVEDGPYGLANAEQLHGKEMSFNNYLDSDAAWSLVKDLGEPGVAIIKHTNPSGVGIGKTNLQAYQRAFATDPISAFGGIVAFNHKVDPEVAAAVIEVFSEVVIAPDYDEAALEIFRAKKNLRVLKVKDRSDGPQREALDIRQISGGFLVQERDTHYIGRDDLKIVTKRMPTDQEFDSMMFAWRVCKHVKSNAIVIANAAQTLGVGSGQMNRVDSIRIAAIRAQRFGHSLTGTALASDAFFPFRDNVDEAAALGVSAIIQPGGSVRDGESVAAADEHGLAMAFTGVRHFRH